MNEKQLKQRYINIKNNLDIKQLFFSKKLNLSHTTLSLWEQDKRPLPSDRWGILHNLLLHLEFLEQEVKSINYSKN